MGMGHSAQLRLIILIFLTWDLQFGMLASAGSLSDIRQNVAQGNNHSSETDSEPYLMQGGTAVVSNTTVDGRNVVTAQILARETLHPGGLGFVQQQDGEDVEPLPFAPITLIRVALRWISHVFTLYSVTRDYEIDPGMCPTQFPNYLEIVMMSLSNIVDICLQIWPKKGFSMLATVINFLTVVLLATSVHKQPLDEQDVEDEDEPENKTPGDEVGKKKPRKLGMVLATGSIVLGTAVLVLGFLKDILPFRIPLLSLLGPIILFLGTMLLINNLLNIMLDKDRLNKPLCKAKFMKNSLLTGLRSKIQFLVVIMILTILIEFLFVDSIPTLGVPSH